MKKMTMILAAAAGLFVWAKRRKAAKEQSAARVGTLGETPIMDGSNWTSDWWSRLQNASDLKDPTAPNLAGGVVADPGRVGQSQIGLSPAWDGSLR